MLTRNVRIAATVMAALGFTWVVANTLPTISRIQATGYPIERDWLWMVLMGSVNALIWVAFVLASATMIHVVRKAFGQAPSRAWSTEAGRSTSS